MNCHSRRCLAWVVTGLLLAVCTALCVQFVDIPVALFVKEHLYANRNWSRLTGDLPDLLLVVVVLTTFTAWAFYMVRSRKGKFDTNTDFARVLTWTTPSSFLAKHVLKVVFGRVNTRRWLEDPSMYGFHWFQRLPHCEGFPSGHMLVFATFLAAVGRFYPKTRPWCGVAGVVLGGALVATNYHFVSDVLAGAYLGALVEAIAVRFLLCEPARLKNSVPDPANSSGP